jgi:hypothetical protein
MLLQNVNSTHGKAVLVCFKKQPRKIAFPSNRLLLGTSVWHVILMFTEHAVQHILIKTAAFLLLLTVERLLATLREEFDTLLLSCRRMNSNFLTSTFTDTDVLQPNWLLYCNSVVGSSIFVLLCRLVFFFQCHHISLMDFVVSPPGCGQV